MSSPLGKVLFQHTLLMKAVNVPLFGQGQIARNICNMIISRWRFISLLLIY